MSLWVFSWHNPQAQAAARCSAGFSASTREASLQLLLWAESGEGSVLAVLGGHFAGCPNHPHHGPAAPWKGSLQQERHLPRAKDAGAWEGERQKDLSVEGSSRAGCRSQTTLLSVPVQPRKLEENKGGEGGDLKPFYSPGMLFQKALLGHSHQLSRYLYNLLTWSNYHRHWRSPCTSAGSLFHSPQQPLIHLLWLKARRSGMWLYSLDVSSPLLYQDSRPSWRKWKAPIGLYWGHNQTLPAWHVKGARGNVCTSLLSPHWLWAREGVWKAGNTAQSFSSSDSD